MKFNTLRTYKTLLNFYKNRFNANTESKIEWKTMMIEMLSERIDLMLKEERVDQQLLDNLDME